MPMHHDPNQPVLCIGSALWDIIASSQSSLEIGSDLPGLIRRRPGGVACNIALVLAARGRAVSLLTVIGNGPEGDHLIQILESKGVDCQYVTRTDTNVDTYMAIEQPNGEVFGAIADCASLELAGDRLLTPLMNGTLADTNAPWRGAAIIDGNLPIAVLEQLLGSGVLAGSKLSFAPASTGKANRMLTALKSGSGTLFVNREEAETLCKGDYITAIAAARELVRIGAERAIVTDGANPVALATADKSLAAMPPNVKAVTTTGAGDCFLAAFVAAELDGQSSENALIEAINAAAQHVVKEVV